VPPSAAWINPTLAEVVLEQVGRNAAAVNDHEGFVLPLAPAMDRLRDQLLARPRFALDQHRRPAGRHLIDEPVDIEHGPGTADDLFELVAFGKRLAQVLVLQPETGRLHRLSDQVTDLGIVERLRDVVESAGLHRGDRVLHGAEGRDHHDGQVGKSVADPAQQVQAVLVGKHHVQQQHVPARLLELGAAAVAIHRDLDVVAIGRKQIVEDLEYHRLVVDDQDTSRHCVAAGAVVQVETTRLRRGLRPTRSPGVRP
jgi:hypothetical protein